MGRTIQLKLDSMPGSVLKLAESSRSIEAAQYVAASLAQTVRDWLTERDARGNKHGWPSTHFYAHAAAGTIARAEVGVAEVTISQVGFAQRYFGGRIVANGNSSLCGRGKFLSIPVNAESYGHRACEFEGLKLVRLGRISALIRPDEVAFGRRKAGAKRLNKSKETAFPLRPGQEKPPGTVLFLLVKSVNQKADPTVLPPDEKLLKVAFDALVEHAAQS